MIYKVRFTESKDRIWDSVEQIETILKFLKENAEKIVELDLSTNSIGFEVAKALSGEIKNLSNLEIVNFRDIFVSRKREDLPKSLRLLIESIQDKAVRVLDLSDNAFGPVGVESFDFFIKETKTLKELYLENNGLGPEGAEMVANAILSNENLKLRVLHVNRNRLENKGAFAFAKYFNLFKI
jgi:Ran GTPase-activating protein 1